jgi:hypothetical protein
MIPRSPRAPPPRSKAFLHISSSAALVNRISTPEYPNNDMYCDTREPLTSVRMRRRSEIVRGVSVVMDGRREMNSGINLSRVISRHCEEREF